MKRTREVKQGSMRVKSRAPGKSTVLAKAARLKVFGKSPVGFYLRLNRSIWETISAGLRNSYPVRSYGAWLHSLVRLHATRQQYFATFFLRNRPALELMRHLAEKKAEGSTLRIAVLACSIGAEVYSILWTIRSARPDLKVLVSAMDISKRILDFAQTGIYASSTNGLVGSSIFERVTAQEMEQIFDLEGDDARIKPWLREGITWQLGDASSPELANVLGPQDIVVANNFLCHMEPRLQKIVCGISEVSWIAGDTCSFPALTLRFEQKWRVSLGGDPCRSCSSKFTMGILLCAVTGPCGGAGLSH